MAQSTGWPGLRILAYVAGLINHDLQLLCEYLMEENRIMKAHLESPLRLTDAERRTLAEIGHRLGKKRLKDAAHLAKPDTSWVGSTNSSPPTSMALRTAGISAGPESGSNWRSWS
jgi:hypothetical protein